MHFAVYFGGSEGFCILYEGLMIASLQWCVKPALPSNKT